VTENEPVRGSQGRFGGWITGDGSVFPTEVGTPQLCSNWRRQGWDKLLERAKVEPREGDAQKALRRSYITSALVCGRNPKLTAAELGHVKARMVVSQYDSFLDPAHGPDDQERGALVSIYEWSDLKITAAKPEKATG
jgi:hypothetical protein